MSIFDLDFDTREGAQKATRNAAVAASISGALTALFSVYALTRGEAVVAGVVTAWNLIDAALLFGLAFGVYKGNRAAAWALMAYWGFNFVVRLLTVGAAALGLNVVFGIFYGNGLRGALALHRQRLEAEENEQLSIFEASGDDSGTAER